MTTSPTAEAAPTVAEFAAEAAAFLDAHAPRRVGSAGTFRWGEGSDAVALFAAIPPAEVERARTWRRTVYDAGFGWITGPAELGGRGLSSAHDRAYARLEAQYDIPSRQALNISLGMVAPTLLDFATEDVKRYWLPRLWRGDAVGCQLFSEPGAGSDLASVTTRAVPDGEQWVVWTSGAQDADIGLLLTRTSNGGRHRNLTAFLVDMHAPGVVVRPLRQMTGGAEFNEVFLTGVRIPDSWRLGDVDNGWRVAVRTLMHERSAIGGTTAGGTGILHPERLLALLRHCGVDGDPTVRQEFARVYCGLMVARWTRQRSAASLRAGQPPGPEGSTGKLAVTNNLRAVSALVSQVLGPRMVADTGAWGEYAWAEYVLGVCGYRIGGGTDEIQRNILAERVLGLPKEADAVANGPGSWRKG
jgi:alkylation response protein AidB-like acyl-CoA dehydrogenase